MKHYYAFIVFLLIANIGFSQIISQYIETNSGTTPKGIEIWNNTGAILDFSTNNLVIEKGTNGGTPSTDFTLSSGTLAVGDVLVIGTSDMETVTLANGSAFFLEAFTFNGDDSLVVRFGGTITDVFGEPGSDPGSAWTGGSVSTANQNIELNSGITTGTTIGFTDPSLRFSVVNTDPSGVNGDEGFGIAPITSGANDTDSEIYAASPQIGNSTIVAANTTSIANDAEVFSFVIEDQGSGDGFSTKVTKMRFVPGANNSTVWSNSIEGITLYDENLVDYTPTVTISDTEIILEFGTPLGIADGSSLEFVLGFFLKATGIVDNSIVQFEVSASSGFETDASGSSFIDPLTFGDFTGPETIINVVASDLAFSQQPSNTEINVAIDPAVLVDAIDTNGNIDLDFTAPINMTVTALTFAGTATTSVNAINGIATFDNLLLNSSGVGTIIASSTGLNDSAASNPFGVAPGRSTIWCETFTDNSLYDVTLGGEGKGPDPIETDYFQITDGTDIDIVYNGNNGNFFAAQDIDDGTWTGSANPSQLTWTGINIEGYEGIRFTGKFASAATDRIDAADNILVEYRIDGTDPWVSFLAFENDGTPSNTYFLEDTDFDGTGDGTQLTNTFQTFSKLLFTSASNTTMDLRITVSINAGAEDAAFEDFKIEGIGGTYPGNTATGFDGPLGTGNFEVDASSGSTINFTFNRGTGGTLGLFNDYIVVYIDSQAGGITSTANLTDAGDDGRKAISGFDGTTLRSTIDFPPGFEPDFAIAMNNGFAGLFEIVENGSHNFIQDATLSPTGTNNASSYIFNIDFASINTLAGGESFKFLATYLNAAGAFRSDESIGDNTATGSPGVNPIEFITYYQATSRKKGGKAPSLADGLWTSNATWVNGNAPLVGDEITINNTVNLNTDYATKNIEITATGIFTINAASNFEIFGGVVGSGEFNVNGNFTIHDGGFTDIIPTYGTSSLLTYNNVIGTYNRYNEWRPGTSGAGVPNQVVINNTNLDLSNPTGNIDDEDFTVGTDLSVLNGANLNIDPTKSLTINGDLVSVLSTVNLNSNSQNYSSLIVGGSSVGDVTYKRHVNSLAGVNTETSDNDLISAPVTNASQTFGTFRVSNPNIPSGTIQGIFSYLFGPFDNINNVYVNYTAANDNDLLIPGVGYRTASTNTSTFTFVGDIKTTNVPVNISIGAGSEWNLIGNPYASYINSGLFLTENAAFLDEDAVGIYGYDGDAESGWDIINYNTLNSTNYNMAPGQGFIVAAEGSATLNFTTGMRTIVGADDFIPMRMENNNHLRLEIDSQSSNYHTDFYFNDNSSLGLDSGYDAALFDSYLPEIYMYSHLVENNSGRSMAIQSLGSTDLSNVSIPLGVHANQGEQISFSISESNLPNTIDVYLDDTVANTSTMLNSSDYIFTPNVTLTGTGRFFLRYSEDALSTEENSFDHINIYTSRSTKNIVITGQLLINTICDIYDIQGRLVSSSTLDHSILENRIDIEGVSTGIYVVKVHNNNRHKSQKLVID